MEITTEMIKELRAATGAGMLDVRKALQDADGDFQKAVDFLREKGMATAAKRADREASNGTVELYSHGGGRVGVMVEVNCETDFVARSEQFRTLAHEIALQIAASAPRYVRENDIPQTELDHEAEIARARTKEEGKPAAVAEKIVAGRLEKFKEDAVGVPEIDAIAAAIGTRGDEDRLADKIHASSLQLGIEAWQVIDEHGKM